MSDPRKASEFSILSKLSKGKKSDYAAINNKIGLLKESATGLYQDLVTPTLDKVYRDVGTLSVSQPKENERERAVAKMVENEERYEEVTRAIKNIKKTVGMIEESKKVIGNEIESASLKIDQKNELNQTLSKVVSENSKQVTNMLIEDHQKASAQRELKQAQKPPAVEEKEKQEIKIQIGVRK